MRAIVNAFIRFPGDHSQRIDSIIKTMKMNEQAPKDFLAADQITSAGWDVLSQSVQGGE
jgi:hypothetical protein